jgi:hypothetical protein
MHMRRKGAESELAVIVVGELVHCNPLGDDIRSSKNDSQGEVEVSEVEVEVESLVLLPSFFLASSFTYQVRSGVVAAAPLLFALFAPTRDLPQHDLLFLGHSGQFAHAVLEVVLAKHALDQRIRTKELDP